MNRVLLFLCVLLSGCAPATPNPSSGELRIVSLSPAVTALLQSMGHGDALVGRSAFCRGCDTLPVVGDLGGADVEALIRLQPTMIFFQRTTAPPPAGATEAARRCGATAHGFPMDNMEDLHASIDGIATVLLAHVDASNLSESVDELHNALRLAVTPSVSLGRSVLLVQGGRQLLAWGGETWLGDVVQAAGFDVLFPDKGWVSISVEDLVRMAPDVLLVLGETPDVDVADFERLNLPAVETGSMHVLSHPSLLLPGVHAAALRTQVDHIAELLAAGTRLKAP